MGKLSGMSQGRFEEIYREGQERFEPRQYVNFKGDYERGLAKNNKKDGDIKLSSGIGTTTLSKDDKSSLNTNYDLLADMTTSYGSAQVMGLYGHMGLLNSKDSAGNNVNFDISKMKEAGQRLTPSEEDVQLQIAFMKMKGVNLSSNISNSSLTQKYNGAEVGSSDHDLYQSRLETGISSYRSAKKRQSGS